MVVKRYGILALLCTFLSFPLLANPAIHFTNVWARETFPMAQTGAVYLTMMNHSGQPVILLSVSVPETIATEAQLHSTRMHDGMMKMREQERGVTLPAHGQAVFQAGGDHIMLLGLKQGLKAGTTIPLTLHFSDASVRSVEVPVKSDSEQANGHQHHQ